MPFWSKKPTVEDQVIELKMTAKTIAMQQKNAEKQAKVFENKMMAEVKKGNQDTAKMYADSCIQMRNQAKQFMVLSCRVEAAAMNMQSMASMGNVSSQMAKSVSILKAASGTTDVAAMYAAMDGFKQACEDSNVMMIGFSEAMGSQTVSSSESADALLQQAQQSVASSTGLDARQVPMGIQQAQPMAGQASVNDDLLSRLNNL